MVPMWPWRWPVSRAEGPVRRRAESEVAEVMGTVTEVVAVIGVGDGDECSGAFADRSAAELGDAPFGDHLVDGVLDGGDDVAGGQGRGDLGDVAVVGGRVQHDEPLTAGGVH